MKLLIFGTGIFFKNRRKEFESSEIVGFVDNDINKQGYQLYGKDIFSPNEIDSLFYDYIVTMGNAVNSISMKEQLFKMNIDFSKVIDFNQFIEIRDGIHREKIVIFGTGVFFERRKRIFTEDIVAYIDNNNEKQGKVFYDRFVIDLKNIECVDYDFIVIMTNPKNEGEIRNQLIDANISKEKVLNFVEYKQKFNKSDFDIWDKHSFEKFFFEHYEQPGLSLKRKLNLYNQKPLVSVITPFYNAGRFFEQTFNCIMNQTFPWFEWIIVNDGSTNQKDIDTLNRLAVLDNRIRIINQKNMGLAAARNTGFREAKTDIVTQIDADDIISPQFLEYTFWGLYYNQDADWTYTWSTGFWGQHYLWREHWDAERLRTFNFLIEIATIRKRAWKEVGGYRVEPFSYNEDWCFWLNMLKHGKKPLLLGGYHEWYRRTDFGMLEAIKKDDEIVQKNRKIIEESAKGIVTDAIVKEYPLDNEKFFVNPEPLVWNKKYIKVAENEGINMLWIVPWMVMGGGDKFNVDATRGLSEKGYNISIISTLKSDNEWEYKYAEFTDEIFCLPNFLDKKNYLSFVEYYILSRNIQVLMVTNSVLGYYMLPHIRKTFPDLLIVDYVHMEEWYWRNGGHARSSTAFDDILEHTYVCNSVTQTEMIEKMGKSREKISTLYIGVDEIEFDKETVEEGYLYSLVNLDTNRPIVLFPCRIHPQKRPFMLLSIAKRVIKDNNEVAFVVVGDGPQFEELKWQIVKEGLANNIFCVGKVDNMKGCYRDAKLTLICSLKEGLSLTAYESCSMGVPVISSDVGGQKDLIDDSIGALISTKQTEQEDLDSRIFDEEEVNAFADKIIGLLSDNVLYEKCSLQAREKILNGFTIRNMVDNLDRELRNGLSSTEMKLTRKKKAKELNDLSSIVDELYVLGIATERFD